MSCFAKQLSFLALLAFLAFAPPRADAREGHFSFSKMTRAESSAAASAVPEANPEGPVEPKGALPPPSKHGYGLYGRGAHEYMPTSTATTYPSDMHRSADKFPPNRAVPTTELANGEVYKDEFDNGERFGNNANEAPFNRGRYERNKQYGMSDTRFYDNGRYYYDINTGRYGYRYESNPMRARPEQYGPVSGRGAGGAGSRGYGYGSGSEFNNGMEYQENQESQEENIP